MSQFLAAELRAAGINPDSVVFGANPDKSVSSPKNVVLNVADPVAGAPKPLLEKFIGPEVVATAPTPKCPCCKKIVHKAEELPFLGVLWHKDCFTCGGLGALGCKRKLTKDGYEQHSEVAYCFACFNKNFKQGAARGTVTNVPEGASKKPEEVTSAVAVADATTDRFKSQDVKPANLRSAGDKFRAPLGGGTNKCPSCAKTVFKMEEIFALNTNWHKQCFTCGGAGGNGGCGRVLTLETFNQHEGKPFCFACFNKLVKANMAKGKMSLESTASAPAPLEAPASAPIAAPSPKASPSPKATTSPKSASSLPSRSEPVVVPKPVPESDSPPEVSPRFVLTDRNSIPSASGMAIDYAYSGLGGYVPDKTKSNAAADKFRVAVSAANKCPSCTKTVFKAEELFALNSFWHPGCFTCGGTGDLGCKRRLTKQDFHGQNGSPYCNACFDKLVKASIQKASIAIPPAFVTTLVAVEPTDSPDAPSVSALSEKAADAPGEVGSVVVAEEPPIVKSQKHKTEEESLPRSSIADRASAFQNNAAAASSFPAAPTPKASTAADKFRAAASAANKCPSCTKTVFKAEELFALNSFWHPGCFTCGGTGDLGCKRRLTKQDFHGQNGSPYCNACFDKLVKASIQKTSVHTLTSPRPITAEEVSVGTSTVTSESPSLKKAEIVSSAPELAAPAVTLKSALPKCVVCATNVYKMEELQALGSTWHKQCFNCGGTGTKGCQRMLTLDSFVERENTPFCAACAAKDLNVPATVDVADAGLLEAIENLELEILDQSSAAGGESSPSDDWVVVADSYSIPQPEAEVEPAVSQSETVPAVAPEAITPPVSGGLESSQEVATIVVAEDPTAAQTESETVPEPETEGDFVPDIVPDSVPEIVVEVPPGESEVESEDYEGSVTFTDVEFNGAVYRGYHLSYEHDFDENGVIYWIGSRARAGPFVNPHTEELLEASMSSVYKGRVDNVVARTIEKAPNYTDNALNSWMKIDLGPYRLLLADNYTLRHGGSSRGNALRNWTLQAKAGEDLNDEGWINLREHQNDTSLTGEPNSSATWELDIPDEISDSSTIGFRHFRIVQHGPNSNGNNCLFCCGIELYGVLFEKLSD